METYVVIGRGSGEYTEKKSSFMAVIREIHSEEEALSFIEETKKQYWDARHNCYAYVLGPNSETARFSDDGEPQGTAGRPILEVLRSHGIHNALIVVTRYFGGVLLGTGGLVRAYTEASLAALASLERFDAEPLPKSSPQAERRGRPRAEKRGDIAHSPSGENEIPPSGETSGSLAALLRGREIIFSCEYGDLSRFESLAQAVGASVLSADYLEKVTYRMLVRESCLERFICAAGDITRGLFLPEKILPVTYCRLKDRAVLYDI